MIGVGFIGCGEIAHIHATCLQRLTGVRLVAAFDIVPEKARAFSTRFGCGLSTSVGGILDHPEVDAVYVCTRHDTHVTLAKQVVKHRKALFLEKPMALDVAEASRLKEEIDRAGIPAAVGFNHRFSPVMQALLAEIRRSQVTIRLVEVHVTPPPFLHGWAGQPRVGGGVLPCLASHALDLAVYISGAEVARLGALSRRLRLPEGYLEDVALIYLEFSSGALGNVIVHDFSPQTLALEPSHRLVFVRVVCDRLTYEVSGFLEMMRFSEEGVDRRRFEPFDQIESWGYNEQARRFVAFASGEPPTVATHADGLRATLLVDAARRSAESGKVVALS